MSNNSWSPFRMSLPVFSLLTLVVMMVTVGCSDNGSSTGPGNGDETADTMSFADDVLPVFQANCSGGSCHVPGPEPSSGLALGTYQALTNGGVVVSGNAENSELIKRLEGRSQPSMPFNRSLLSASTIKPIRDWIDQGAKDN